MTRIDDIHGDSPRRLYRDPANGWLAGVCAGLADYLSVSPAVIRLLTIIGLIFFNFFVVIAYIVLAVALPVRPNRLYRGPEDERFWRSVRTSPRETFEHVRHQFREMDRRLQRMERYVTSERFRLDREFRDLER